MFAHITIQLDYPFTRHTSQTMAIYNHDMHVYIHTYTVHICAAVWYYGADMINHIDLIFWFVCWCNYCHWALVVGAYITPSLHVLPTHPGSCLRSASLKTCAKSIPCVCCCQLIDYRLLWPTTDGHSCSDHKMGVAKARTGGTIWDGWVQAQTGVAIDHREHKNVGMVVKGLADQLLTNKNHLYK